MGGVVDAISGAFGFGDKKKRRGGGQAEMAKELERAMKRLRRRGGDPTRGGTLLTRGEPTELGQSAKLGQ